MQPYETGKMGGNLAYMEVTENVHKTFVRKPEGERPLGRQSIDNNIKMYIQSESMTGFIGLRTGFFGKA
jgi:hypothetical protein